MVPKGGLEPPRVAPHAPQTCASANSATSAPARGEYARAPSALSMSPGRRMTAGRHQPSRSRQRSARPTAGRSPANTNGASNSRLAKPGIEGVPDPLAHVVVGENRDKNRQPGVEGEPPGISHRVFAVG